MNQSNRNYEERGTATHFANWVFEKTNPEYKREEYTSTLTDRQVLGQFAHMQIDNFQFWLKSVKAAQNISSNWELVYSDPHDDSEAKVFYASRLKVDNTPMRCRPDVVFHNKDSNSIIVLERKITHWKDEHVPSDTWPNIRAQLWCYGWIDDWADAQEVILVCQFWRRRVEAHCQDTENPWILNYEIHPGWLRSNTKFHSEILKYFNDYGGKFID